MSAYTVTQTHIDALVNAALRFGQYDQDQRVADSLGSMLWDENYASVNYRYSESEPTPDYRASLTDAELSPVAVLKAMRCYGYQSCEHPGWMDSRSFTLLETLERVILQANPELAPMVPSQYDRSRLVHAYELTPEYDAAAWEVTSLDQVTAKAVAAVKVAERSRRVHKFEGAAYLATERLDVKEIAKRVRVSLRNAQELGGLPAEATFSVAISRYSGGQSIDVTLSGMPDSWTYVSPGTPANWSENVPPNGGQSEAATAAVELAKELLNAYNYDNSDSMTDYFDVRYYGHVTIRDESWQRFADRERFVKAAQKAASAERKANGLATKGRDAQWAAARVARQARLDFDAQH